LGAGDDQYKEKDDRADQFAEGGGMHGGEEVRPDAHGKRIR
jgi:hypothetical protein